MNMQELEAMEKRFADTRAEMGARLEGLETVIAQLQQQLQQQRAKCMQHRGGQLPFPPGAHDISQNPSNYSRSVLGKGWGLWLNPLAYISTHIREACTELAPVVNNDMIEARLLSAVALQRNWPPRNKNPMLPQHSKN